MQKLIMVLFPVFIGVIGQIFLKKGMNEVGAMDFSSLQSIVPQFIKAFMNISVLAGFFFYFLSSLFWMIVLSKVELSFAYPLLSVGYVAVLLASWFFFNETISLVRWGGVVFILLGVSLIAQS